MVIENQPLRNDSFASHKWTILLYCLRRFTVYKHHKATTNHRRLHRLAPGVRFRERENQGGFQPSISMGFLHVWSSMTLSELSRVWLPKANPIIRKEHAKHPAKSLSALVVRWGNSPKFPISLRFDPKSHQSSFVLHILHLLSGAIKNTWIHIFRVDSPVMVD